MVEEIGVSQRSIERNIQALQADGQLRREGGRKEGVWEVVKDEALENVLEKCRKSIGKVSEKILSACRENPSITISEMAEKIDVSERTIERNINNLQTDGLLQREGGRKEGWWDVSS